MFDVSVYVMLCYVMLMLMLMLNEQAIKL